jgi:hypothetical protein
MLAVVLPPTGASYGAVGLAAAIDQRRKGADAMTPKGDLEQARDLGDVNCARNGKYPMILEDYLDR